jgi:hypothetical protein
MEESQSNQALEASLALIPPTNSATQPPHCHTSSCRCAMRASSIAPRTIRAVCAQRARPAHTTSSPTSANTLASVLESCSAAASGSAAARREAATRAVPEADEEEEEEDEDEDEEEDDDNDGAGAEVADAEAGCAGVRSDGGLYGSSDNSTSSVASSTASGGPPPLPCEVARVEADDETADDDDDGDDDCDSEVSCGRIDEDDDDDDDDSAGRSATISGTKKSDHPMGPNAFAPRCWRRRCCLDADADDEAGA